MTRPRFLVFGTIVLRLGWLMLELCFGAKLQEMRRVFLLGVVMSLLVRVEEGLIVEEFRGRCKGKEGLHRATEARPAWCSHSDAPSTCVHGQDRI